MLIFIGLVFVLIGLGVFASGIFSVFRTRRELAASVKAQGTVIGFGQIQGRSGYLYCPQVSFPLPNGQIFRFQSETGTQPPAYQVGQKVPVVYQLNDPQRAEIDSAMALWFAPGCLTLMGVLFLFLGLTLFGFGVLIAVKT